MTVRAVVVGAGLMGRWHAHALSRAGGRLVAVVDSDVRRAEDLAQRGTFVAGDLAEAISRIDVDVVHICTPLATHEPLIASALEAGHHVVAEKPLSTDAASTERLLTLARSNGVSLTPVHQFPFQRGVQRMRERDALFGSVRSLAGVVCSAGADGRSDEERDVVAGEILPHFLSLTADFTAHPIDSAAASWTRRRSGAGEWSVEGAVGDVDVSIRVSMSVRPTRNTWEVRGTGATARADLFHGYAVFERGEPTRATKVVQPFAVSSRTLISAAANLGVRAVHREWAYPGLRQLIAASYEGIRGRAPAPIAPERTLAIARVHERLVRGDD